MKLFDLTGKIALITGSSRGLGFVLAKGLAQAGATVVLNGLNSQRLQEAKEQLAKEGLLVKGYAFDITDLNQIQMAVAQIEQDLGQIDILVNNAGIQIRAPLEQFDPTDWDKIIKTNLTSAFLVSQAVVKGMIRRQSGKIINICSMQSELGRPTIAPYAASKGGLKMLTKAMATEWAKYNIQINGIGPGYFITEMTKPLADNPEFDRWLKSRTPSGRWGQPEELIGAAIFLASDASSYVNGHVLYVDGGMLASV